MNIYELSFSVTPCVTQDWRGVRESCFGLVLATHVHSLQIQYVSLIIYNPHLS